MPGRTARTIRGGTALAEATLIIPIFFMLIFGIFEYGRFFMMRNLIADAAREGTRFAVVHTADKTTADVQNTVLAVVASQQSQLRNLTIQVYATDANGNPLAGVPWTNAAFGSGIGVQVDGDYTPVTPVFLLMPNLVHLTTVSIMNSEAN